MNRRRAKPAFEPTIVDTIITAVAPALIICMISSLVFFLIIAFYRSEYSARLMYILGLYTFATVLVARIAIESGRAHANLFGIALFGAACVAMFRFVSISGPMAAISPVINVGLLLIAWYLADRITFDCTLVDEREEVIQKGLLQSLNLIDKDPPTPSESTERGQDEIKTDKKAKRKTKKHNPGVWVLYFALLAIPLFGLGQIAIPDEAIRRQAFIYLLIYLACALTLLLTTSFVAMRRYLRQRGVEMPGEMTRLWLASGVAGIAVILIGCLVLPLPTKRGVGFAWLPFDFTSPQGLSTSKWGWGNEGPNQSQSSQDNEDQNAIVKPAADQAKDASGSPQENGKGPQEPSENGQKQSSQSGQSKPDSKANAKSADSKSSKPSNSDSKDNDSKSNSNSDSSKSTAANSKQSPSKDKKSEQSSSNDKSNQSKSKSESTKSNENSDAESREKANEKENSDSPSEEKSKSDQQNKPNQGKSPDSRTSEQPKKNTPTQNAEKSDPNKSDANKPENQSPDDQRESVDRPKMETTPPSNPASSFQLPSNLSAFFKWILIAVLVGILVIYAITHPKELAQFWNDLLRMFEGWFGTNSKRALPATSDLSIDDAEQSTKRPFSSFPDPFRDGSGMNPKQIVAYTFAALEAWAEERGNQRATDQTAEEFARQLAQKQPKIASHATSAAQMLDRVMFAGWAPTVKEVSHLAQLWMLMRSS